MSVLLPFAAPPAVDPAAPGVQVLRNLALPGLRGCLARMTEVHRDVASETSLSPPHERALARALGWQADDGGLPLAAWWAAQDGLAFGELPVALVTPTHWHLGTEQLSLLDPAALVLDAAASRAFFDAVAPLFTSECFAMAHGAPGRWYLGHASLAATPTASLDRVIGRNVDPWLGSGARLLRRLQNEVQMLLHGHALNAERERHGQLAVNSIWISGSGAPLPARGAAPCIDERLRRPALAEDWAGWAKAWEQIDAELAADPPAALTLCGERGYASFQARPQGLLAGLAARWRGVNVHELLLSL